MKKNILFLVLCFVTVLPGFTQAGKLVQLEEAIESASLRIKISKNLTGVVTGQICQTCEKQVVKITPETLLYVNGQPVALNKAALRSGKPGTAIYNIKTRKVTKIMSYE